MKPENKTSHESGYKYETDKTMREQVDIILDKISQSGYDSLSEKEKQTLYLASKYFAGQHKKS